MYSWIGRISGVVESFDRIMRFQQRNDNYLRSAYRFGVWVLAFSLKRKGQSEELVPFSFHVQLVHKTFCWYHG